MQLWKRLCRIARGGALHLDAAAGERLVAQVARRTQPVPHDKALDAIRLAIAVPCYEAPLRAAFRSVSVAVQANGFRVYEARR